VQNCTLPKKLKKLDNVKIGDLKRRTGIIKVPKQDEDVGNLQNLRSLF